MDTSKWPGGKGQKFAQVRPHIPPFKTYAEPFFGGGAFFFSLMPRHSLLNDVNSKLMGLYVHVRDRNPAFESAIFAYVDAWERLHKTVRDLQPPLLALYHELRGNPVSSQSVAACLSTYQEVFALFPVLLWLSRRSLERHSPLAPAPSLFASRSWNTTTTCALTMP